MERRGENPAIVKYFCREIPPLVVVRDRDLREGQGRRFRLEGSELRKEDGTREMRTVNVAADRNPRFDRR